MTSIAIPTMYGDSSLPRKSRWQTLKNMARDIDQIRQGNRAYNRQVNRNSVASMPDILPTQKPSLGVPETEIPKQRRTSRLSMLGRSSSRLSKPPLTEEEAFFEKVDRCELNESRLASAFRKRGLYGFQNLLVRTLNGDTSWLPTGAVVDPRYADYPVEKDVAEFVCQLCLVDADGRYYDERLRDDEKARMVRYWFPRGGREHAMPALRTDDGRLGFVRDFAVDLKQWRS